MEQIASSIGVLPDSLSTTEGLSIAILHGAEYNYRVVINQWCKSEL